MTPEGTKSLLQWQDANRAAMEAHAEGKEIEYYDSGYRAWKTCAGGPDWCKRSTYRVKPEPKLRPYTVDEAKNQVGETVIHIQTGERFLVDAFHGNELYLSRYGVVERVVFAACFTHKDGSPCGVTE